MLYHAASGLAGLLAGSPGMLTSVLGVQGSRLFSSLHHPINRRFGFPSSPHEKTR
jgi:hypothetical protein